MLTLGSLFDGSGGFPLAAQNVGIKPVWASEIEPFPIRVTRKRFPKMKHLGDVTRLDGSKIEPVDVITFSSPCTDLSIGGRFEGLRGKQSSLFFEAIRIIKEMRSATKNKYPRYAVWENVLGAFSSNKGDDFNSIIEQFLSIKNLTLSAPRPKKWSKAGAVLGPNFSLAWRSLNSKFWGVPQARRRVFIVCDFEHGDRGGAGEILFERQGMSGDTEPGREERSDVSPSYLRCVEAEHTPIDFNPTDTRLKIRTDGTIQTLTSRMGTGGNYVPLILGPAYSTSRAYHLHTKAFCEEVDELHACDYKDPHCVLAPGAKLLRRITPRECARLQGFPDTWCDDLVDQNPSKEDMKFFRWVWDEWNELQGKRWKSDNQIRKWLASPPTDAAMYKMFGNGVALPCVEFIMRRIKEVSLQQNDQEASI